MLARRAAAEVVAGDEDGRVTVGGLVEDEVGEFDGDLGAVLGDVVGVGVAQLRKGREAESRPADGLEVFLRDDHVCVDVLDVERRGGALEVGELGDAAPGAGCLGLADDGAGRVARLIVHALVQRTLSPGRRVLGRRGDGGEGQRAHVGEVAAHGSGGGHQR